MWRAFFLAAGLYLVLLGAQCLVIEKVTLTIREKVEPEVGLFANQEPRRGPKLVANPPDWAPYSLMSGGAVVCLYSFTIPVRLKKS